MILNQTNEFLIDQDGAKLKNTLNDLPSGKYIFKYSPHKLIDELLESPPNIRTLRNPKFLPLLKDYFYILALVLKQSQELLGPPLAASPPPLYPGLRASFSSQ